MKRYSVDKTRCAPSIVDLALVPSLNGPIIDLCDIAADYAAGNRAKAKRLRSACYKGTQSPRADDLESSALIIEQLVKVMRPLSDFKVLCETEDAQENTPSKVCLLSDFHNKLYKNEKCPECAYTPKSDKGG